MYPYPNLSFHKFNKSKAVAVAETVAVASTTTTTTPAAQTLSAVIENIK
jgi:hypothetical protein